MTIQSTDQPVIISRAEVGVQFYYSFELGDGFRIAAGVIKGKSIIALVIDRCRLEVYSQVLTSACLISSNQRA